MERDLFGYKSQGMNYERYRPKYPPSMLDNLTAQLKGKTRYLDVATGTGQILLQIYNHFEHSSGLDISQNMLNACKENVKQRKIEGVDLRLEDFMKADLKQSYDLITIGQALHWFPVRNFLEKAKNSLTDGGIFATLGYIFVKIEANNPEQMPQLPQLFEKFYQKNTKQHFPFNMDDLHNHYSQKEKYPFEQVFPKVNRSAMQIPIIWEKQEFLAYIKSLSMYNIYLQKFRVDPLSEMVEKIPPKMKIRCTFDFFSIICTL